MWGRVPTKRVIFLTGGQRVLLARSQVHFMVILSGGGRLRPAIARLLYILNVERDDITESLTIFLKHIYS